MHSTIAALLDRLQTLVSEVDLSETGVMTVMQDYPPEYTRNCTVADDYTVRKSMVPNSFPKLPRSPYGLPNDDPPVVPGKICNIAMPDRDTRKRLLWVSY